MLSFTYRTKGAYLKKVNVLHNIFPNSNIFTTAIRFKREQPILQMVLPAFGKVPEKEDVPSGEIKKN